MARDTIYVETAALLAILEHDDAEARRLIGDMLPNERRALAQAADKLSALCGSL